MSARDQAKRDAEFDRLLAETRFEGGETADFYLGSAMAKAYEMGKRHGREEIEQSPLWVRVRTGMSCAAEVKP